LQAELAVTAVDRWFHRHARANRRDFHARAKLDHLASELMSELVRFGHLVDANAAILEVVNV
jgi:hypothetical protein